MEAEDVKLGATSSTSVTETVNVVLEVDWSALVALTVMSQLLAVSKSIAVLSETVIMPDEAPIWKASEHVWEVMS